MLGFCSDERLETAINHQMKHGCIHSSFCTLETLSLSSVSSLQNLVKVPLKPEASSDQTDLMNMAPQLHGQ